jgi:hypothetical protein
MKKIKFIISVIALAGMCFNASAQNKDAQGKQAQDAQMKAWMAYMTPGPMHEMLAKSNGDWNEEVTMWMAPGTPPTKSTATCTNKMILGNRYQESHSTGSMNGMPFEGTSTVGYDNIKKVFMSTWIDNMGTGIMYMEGKYDEKTKTVAFSGSMIDPMTGKAEKVRENFKMIDDNNQMMEMYSTHEGKEFKTMEIKFTRKM